MRGRTDLGSDSNIGRGQVWLRFLAGVLCIGASVILLLAQAEISAAWLLMLSGVLFGIVGIVDAVKARQARREAEPAEAAGRLPETRRLPQTPGR